MGTSLTSAGIAYPDGSSQTFAPGIKSVQTIFANPYGTLSGGDYSYSVNLSINAVDVTKSFILRPGTMQWDNYYYDSGLGWVYETLVIYVSVKFVNITNNISSTVQLSQTYGYNTGRSFRFQIIEFK